MVTDTRHTAASRFCVLKNPKPESSRSPLPHANAPPCISKDLVEWQLRVAAGQPLPLTKQTDVTLSGHAVEARICAENAEKGFLPAAGTLRRMRLPSGVDIERGDGSGLKTRVDTGVKEGDVVSTYYDPMVAKVGPNFLFLLLCVCASPSMVLG